MNHEDGIIPQTDGSNSEHGLRVTPAEDEAVATALSNVLSIRNPSGPRSAHSSSGPPSGAGPDQTLVPTSSHFPPNSLSLGSSDRPNASMPSSSSSIINRRNASRKTATQQSSDDPSSASTSNSEEPARPSSNFADYLRSITPTQPIMQEEENTPNGSPSALATTPTGAELANEGPMTPTNNAGPFVFDGSAGRAAGRRTVAGMVQDTGSIA